MSIIVGTSASTGSVQAGGYIVINLGASSQPVIDWTATAGTYPTGLGNTGWTALLGGAVSGSRSAGCANRFGGATRLSDGRRLRWAAAVEIVILGKMSQEPENAACKPVD